MWIGSIDANYSRGLTAGFEIVPAPFPRVNLGDKLHHQDFDIWQGIKTEREISGNI
jgi:hypothetical protein